MTPSKYVIQIKLTLNMMIFRWVSFFLRVKYNNRLDCELQGIGFHNVDIPRSH